MAAGFAVAGPPYSTDDPEPAEYGHSEFYAAMQETRTADGWAGAIPFVEYNYGATPGVHLHVGIPLAFDAPETGHVHAGIGDFEMGAKVRFLQEHGSVPAMAIYPTLFAPTGKASQGLGSGDFQVFLPLWLQRNWSGWQGNAGAGYKMDFSTSSENHWFIGVQLQRDLSSRLTLGGEIFRNTANAPWEDAGTAFDLGLVWNLDESNHLLFSAGRGLTKISETNEFSSYLAYQRTW